MCVRALCDSGEIIPRKIHNEEREDRTTRIIAKDIALGEGPDTASASARQRQEWWTSSSSGR